MKLLSAATRRRGSSTIMDGRPVTSADPSTSVSTAAAPRALAAAVNAAPWALAPGRATYRSPALTCEECRAMPVTVASPVAVVSSSAASSVNDQTGGSDGRVRISSLTPRPYLPGGTGPPTVVERQRGRNRTSSEAEPGGP